MNSTCYVCMIDNLELTETCGQLTHEVCKECRPKIQKCPLCRTPIEKIITEIPLLPYDNDGQLAGNIVFNVEDPEFIQRIQSNWARIQETLAMIFRSVYAATEVEEDQQQEILEEVNIDQHMLLASIIFTEWIENYEQQPKLLVNLRNEILKINNIICISEEQYEDEYGNNEIERYHLFTIRQLSLVFKHDNKAMQYVTDYY